MQHQISCSSAAKTSLASPAPARKTFLKGRLNRYRLPGGGQYHIREKNAKEKEHDILD
jgi:hypothetical protein